MLKYSITFEQQTNRMITCQFAVKQHFTFNAFTSAAHQKQATFRVFSLIMGHQELIFIMVPVRVCTSNEMDRILRKRDI